jgi:type VI secretion system protein ImpG
MDSRLLDHYDAELRHLQASAHEFALEFPKIASRLSLKTGEFPCADPYVERLLEGFAYLSARVQLKLDAEFPRFTQTLLETVCPHLLGPTPSMTIVEFEPMLANPELAEGFTLPRGTVLKSSPGGQARSQTPCEYRTASPVTMWPIELVEARYLTREMGVLQLPDPPVEQRARAALALRFKVHAGFTPAKLAKLDTLRLFLAEQTAGRLYEQLMASTLAVAVRPATRPPGAPAWLPADSVARVGYGADEAMLPIDLRSFQGYRLLQEYFALPQRFMFAELRGLRPALARCTSSEFEIIVLFSREDLALEGRVATTDFSLTSVPAINLFPRAADRIFITDRAHEHPVIVDRTRSLDYEVYSVTSVTGYGERTSDQRTFTPFFASGGLDAPSVQSSAGPAYYATHRVSRQLTEDERRAGRSRRSYAGSEVYISLVDTQCVPRPSNLTQLGVECIVTNRDLPIDITPGRGGGGGGAGGSSAFDFVLEVSAPLSGIRCKVRPTVPRPSHAERQTAWRLISHLSLNYLSLTDMDGPANGSSGSPAGDGAVSLRELLRLYIDASNPADREQVAGVRSIKARPHIQPVAGGGVITFARGLEVAITLDDRSFVGYGPYVLGSVLEQFFARYVTVNSFTQTLLKTTDRGEIARWPARLGQRPML